MSKVNYNKLLLCTYNNFATAHKYYMKEINSLPKACNCSIGRVIHGFMCDIALLSPPYLYMNAVFMGATFILIRCCCAILRYLVHMFVLVVLCGMDGGDNHPLTRTEYASGN